jgi:hypothetical protein
VPSVSPEMPPSASNHRSKSLLCSALSVGGTIDPTGPPVTDSVELGLVFKYSFSMLTSKIHILSSRDPNEVVQILFGSLETLVFNKNIKLGIFYRKNK